MMRLSRARSCGVVTIVLAGAGALAAAAASGCAGGAGRAKAPRPRAEWVSAAAPAVDALRAGNFEDAATDAAAVLAADADNPYARLVAGIARYRSAAHAFVTAAFGLAGGVEAGRMDYRYLKFTLDEFSGALAKVDEDLAVAARDSGVTLELCPACWKIDWNGSGSVDANDERLFETELDASGGEIPEGDARRKPTFRFDVGDVYWARAMVSFQRAAVELIAGYDFSDLEKVLALARGPEPEGDPSFTIRVAERARILRGRDLILAGLENADRARKEYLAETDDDREWVPNPAQHSHPLPLPVDAALYATWEGVNADVRKLVRGEEGIDVAVVAKLGDRDWADPPRGFVDVGRLLGEPTDLTVRLSDVLGLEKDHGRRSVEKLLGTVLGKAYVKSMRSSGLLARFERMKGEAERGEESLERKLRYLLWVN